MKILNLTQHNATQEQIEAGVFEPENKALVQELLTFDFLPTPEIVASRAHQLAALVMDIECEAAMIGGAPFLMSALENALQEIGVQPLYAFSVRESVDQRQPDGSIKKIAVFRHRGFAESAQRCIGWRRHNASSKLQW